MTVELQTFDTLRDASTAVGREPGARFLGGGTLLVRALNEEVADFSTMVRCTDRQLVGSAHRGLGFASAPGSPWRESLRAPSLPSSTRPPLRRRPRGTRAGDRRGQSVRAPALRGLCRRPACARRASLRPERIQPT